ncbi:MAG: HDOD domain-containing protein [Gemmatimonadaceae bacterium]
MIAHFEQGLRSSIDRVSRSLTAAEQTEDSARLLRTLRETSATGIRQAPAAAQRALAKTRNPDIGIGQLVQVVEEDPTLGQALLSYANSAYYSTGGTVLSLRQAGQRVGATGVHNVVLSVMLDGMLCRPGAGYQGMVDQVRAHLVRTASIARMLARSFGVAPDDGFTLALLHDAGKLIVFDTIGTLRHELRRDVAIPPAVISRILMHVHEPLGGLAALRWGLGPEVALPIAAHHRSPMPEDGNVMSELLFVAERVDHALNGVIPMDTATWWSEGKIRGTPERADEIIAGYAATEMAA